MIAAILKTTDGQFDYLQLFILLFKAAVSLLLVAVICWFSWEIHRALKLGYTPLYWRRTPRIRCYIERKKDRSTFWYLVLLRCVLIGVSFFIIWAVIYRFAGI
jgi:hypothetical protein